MNQNTSPAGAGLPPAGEDAVVARATQRALARRQAVYAEEVRRLLDAGLAVMRQFGTTRSPRVSDIVEAAGLSRDAFYRHFASKEDLVAAIVEAGEQRLVSYLRHQMAKERNPGEQLRRWVEGIMAQATNPEVAQSTRAVLWNGGRVRDDSWTEAVTGYASLAELIREPIAALGSPDPQRDAVVSAHATMGVMREFLWKCAVPTKADIANLVRFCTAPSGRRRLRGLRPPRDHAVTAASETGSPAERPVRLPPLPESGRSARQQEVIDDLVRSPTVNIYTTVARAPDLAAAMFHLGRALRSGTLPERHREILILRTGCNCDAQYELAQHYRVATEIGMTAADMARIREGPRAEGWEPFEAVVCRAADELHMEYTLTDQTWRALAERYDEQQLILATALVGYYHLVSFVLNALGIPLEEGALPFPAS